MTRAYKNLLLEQEEGVATVILNRPEIHNAFNAEMIVELTEVFSGLAKDPAIRVILIRGAGDSFCAGADLHWMKEVAGYGKKENIRDAKTLHQMLWSITTCPKPVLARVNGHAIGGGAGLVAAADMALAEEEAQFGFSEVRLGLIPAVISPFVLRKIGERNAREYFLSGERFSAELARNMGLVQYVGSPEDVENLLGKKIDHLKTGGPEALAKCKALIGEVAGLPLEKAGELTARRIAECRASPEGKEGIESFLSKRKPSWVK